MTKPNFFTSSNVKLLLEAGAQINLQNDDGWSALMMAATVSPDIGDGHAAVGETLVKAGADLEHTFNETGDTCLLFFARRGHKHNVKLLLEHGAKNAKNKDGMNAADLAMKIGFETVQILEFHGILSGQVTEEVVEEDVVEEVVGERKRDKAKVFLNKIGNLGSAGSKVKRLCCCFGKKGAKIDGEGDGGGGDSDAESVASTDKVEENDT